MSSSSPSNGRINIRFAVIFYSALLAGGLIWIWLRGDPMLFVHPDWVYSVDSGLLLRSLMLGVCTAVGVVALSRLSSRYFAWARFLERQFAELLGPLSGRDIVVLALCSGVCEEVFFRAAMQPSLGLWTTSILFGVMHIGPGREYLPWTASAFGIGLLIGWYYEITGSLAAPVACHFLVNLINLHFINRQHARQAPNQPNSD